MSKLYDLIDAFLNELEDAQKEAVIQQIEREDPAAARVLRRIRNMEKRADRVSQRTDEILDMLDEGNGR